MDSAADNNAWTPAADNDTWTPAADNDTWTPAADNNTWTPAADNDAWTPAADDDTSGTASPYAAWAQLCYDNGNRFLIGIVTLYEALGDTKAKVNYAKLDENEAYFEAQFQTLPQLISHFHTYRRRMLLEIFDKIPNPTNHVWTLQEQDDVLRRFAKHEYDGDLNEAISQVSRYHANESSSQNQDPWSVVEFLMGRGKQDPKVGVLPSRTTPWSLTDLREEQDTIFRDLTNRFGDTCIGLQTFLRSPRYRGSSSISQPQKVPPIGRVYTPLVNHTTRQGEAIVGSDDEQPALTNSQTRLDFVVDYKKSIWDSIPEKARNVAPYGTARYAQKQYGAKTIYDKTWGLEEDQVAAALQQFGFDKRSRKYKLMIAWTMQKSGWDERVLAAVPGCAEILPDFLTPTFLLGPLGWSGSVALEVSFRAIMMDPKHADKKEFYEKLLDKAHVAWVDNEITRIVTRELLSFYE
ncbi:hypothetical protein CHU98_g10282 [Xylaria longipes]|nr:hypothetical protein CHU98_g10282 [Xylaria longipes]